MDRPLDGQLQSAVQDIEMMFETPARRKRIIDARPARQFARQKLAVEPERGRRDRPAAEAGRRVDPFRLVALPDQRGRVVLDIGKQAGDRGAVRAGEASEHGGRRAHLAILDARQGRAADPAQPGQLVERPAPRPPQPAQPFRESQTSPARQCICFHIRNNILDNESVKTRRSSADKSLSLEDEGRAT